MNLSSVANSKAEQSSIPDVKIQIKYFANLGGSSWAQRRSGKLLAGQHPASSSQVLNDRYGILLPNKQIMAVLNGRGWMQYSSKPSTEIKDGDVILLFPPISGGKYVA